MTHQTYKLTLCLELHLATHGVCFFCFCAGLVLRRMPVDQKPYRTSVTPTRRTPVGAIRDMSARYQIIRQLVQIHFGGLDDDGDGGA